MKTTLQSCCLRLLHVASTVLAARNGPRKPNDRSEQWKKVEAAIGQASKTAIELLQPILDAAVADKDYPEAIKAIGRKIALEGMIQGDGPEGKITRMDAEIAKAPVGMRPMMEVVQAKWYWQYFAQNRWRFIGARPRRLPRTGILPAWDLPRLFSEIDKHFQKALAAEEQLKQIPVQTFGGLLEAGVIPDSYRPTLYDFVAHQALDFYNSGEQAAARPKMPSSSRPTVPSSGRSRSSWPGRSRAATTIRPRSKPSGSTRNCSASINTTRTSRPCWTPTSSG